MTTPSGTETAPSADPGAAVPGAPMKPVSGDPVVSPGTTGELKPLRATTMMQWQKVLIISIILAAALGLFRYLGVRFMPFVADFHGGLLGGMAWLVSALLALPYYSLTVPGLTMWVTLDPFAKTYSIYPAGFHFKLFWETVQHKVDLQKEEKLESKKPDGGFETYTTSDGVLMSVQWVVIMRPNPEYILNYISWRPEAIRAVINGEVNLFFSDYFAKKNVNDIIQKKAELSKELAKLFEEEETSKLEMRYGVRVSNPQLYDADLDPEAQKAMATKSRTRFIKEAALDLKKEKRKGGEKGEGKEIDIKEALDTVLLINDNAQKQIVDVHVTGLENLQNLALTGIPGIGRRGKKGKGGKPEEKPKSEEE
ncbi:MAG: SPFH domain-containing protein [Candidatus Taylorbacteria bacterium]|nr:SPFH domain-containing protein [Candidatus Taylorbacteria bacterium]